MKMCIWYLVPTMIVLSLCVANIVASAHAVNMGERMRNLDVKQIALHREQKELDTELASARSLHILKNEAIAQGYVRINRVAIINTTRPVAMK